MPEAASRPGKPRPAQGSRDEALADLGTSFRGAYRSLRSLRGRETHRLPGEVGHAQFELLAELHDRGPLSAIELGRVAALSPATVSQMLDRLDSEGHVKRVRSEADRRVVLTELTPRGAETVATARAFWGLRWREALADVEAEELRTATRVLEQIGAVFAEGERT